MGARIRDRGEDRRAHPLPGHLDQPEFGHGERARAGPVASEVGAEFVEHPVAVLLRVHVDEVHDHDSADVAEPELAGDLARRLEVGLPDERRGVVLLLAREAAGVDVDRDQRLGGLDHDMATGLEPDLAAEGAVDLLLDAAVVEQRLLALVELQPIEQVGSDALHVALDLAMNGGRIHRQRVELVAEQVADDAADQLRLATHDPGLGGSLRGPLDLEPASTQARELAREPLLGRLLAHRAHDHPAGIRRDHLAGERAKSRPLFAVLDLAADAHARRERHVDQEAACQRHLGGQARPLGADGLLGDLHCDPVALAQQLLDRGGLAVAAVPGRFSVFVYHVRDVQETRLPDSDVDESRLNARKNRLYASQEHVAHQPSLVGAVQHQFYESLVFQKRHPRLARGRTDDDFSPQIPGFSASNGARNPPRGPTPPSALRPSRFR